MKKLIERYNEALPLVIKIIIAREDRNYGKF